jgi:hypothetical protein
MATRSGQREEKLQHTKSHNHGDCETPAQEVPRRPQARGGRRRVVARCRACSQESKGPQERTASVPHRMRKESKPRRQVAVNEELLAHALAMIADDLAREASAPEGVPDD